MRKRTISDRIISCANFIRFTISEPIKLAIARVKYEKYYKEPEKNPLISVYTPTYNRGDILVERAIQSVLSQTYKNFEYIIIGDHCTDNTVELVSKIDDARIKLLNLPERKKRYPNDVEIHWFAGPVVPANTALNMVKGKWIARIDDDDIWTPDHLETLLRFAQKGQYEYVSGQYIEERNGKRILVDEKNTYPRMGGTLTWFYRSYLKFFKYNINCWRKSWNRVNDRELVDRMYRAGVRYGFLEKVVGFILPRPGEKTIGYQAYTKDEKNKLKHFTFND